ncbi:MAG TPA: hypothetical protein PKB04_10510 [Phenylobacterium sp.]|mgnify:CR=1 FL=1|nr:hypothetical protein [Phenylobacterium sp.]HMP62909.1 hypothetical protein [Phenylobacterium sp.]
MSEVEFDRALERMFRETPPISDNEVFVARVARRLERGWAARRMLIGAAGLVGGVIGASQLIMSNLLGRAEFTGVDSTRIVTSSVRQLAPQLDWLFSRPAGVETIWVAAGLALLALGFAVTRIIEEL